MRNVKQVGFWWKNKAMKRRWRRLPPTHFRTDFHSALLLRMQRIIAVFYLGAAFVGLLFHL